jgi:hypothetical protein
MVVVSFGVRISGLRSEVIKNEKRTRRWNHRDLRDKITGNSTNKIKLREYSVASVVIFLIT